MDLPLIPSFRITVCCVAVTLATALNASQLQADNPFRTQVAPFVQRFCSECHNPDLSEAELNLTKYQSSESLADDFRQWEHVITFVQRNEMPPLSAKQKPTAEERRSFLDSVRTVLDNEAKKLAGDPGIVLPRRLSNAEYDHSVRDLTGVNIRPTRSFPVDPAAAEGFNNTGEALTVSPGLFAKLYSAAQHVADHAVLTTKGLEFAPYPVVTLADKTTFYEQAILHFYEQHQVDLERYLLTVWEVLHSPVKDKNELLDELATSRKLSRKYLRALHDLLNGNQEPDNYYVGWLRQRWNEIPGPANPASLVVTDEIKDAIKRLARDIHALSKYLCPPETEAIVSNAGNAPIEHLARRRKTAGERDSFSPLAIQPNRRLHLEFQNLDRDPLIRFVIAASSFQPAQAKGNDAHGNGLVILKSLNFSSAPQDQYRVNDEKRNHSLKQILADFAPDQLARLKFGVHPKGATIDAEACILASGDRLEFEIPVKAFANVRHVHFFVDAELDRSQPKSDLICVTLVPGQEGTGKPSPNESARDRRADALANLLVPPDHPAVRELASSGALFCRYFPNRFYYVDETRGLSAGFHLIEGFFRDDQPLCKSVLDEGENQELDQLWTELEFVTEITEKMLRGFVFFERSERNFLKHESFDRYKEDDPALIEPETLLQFEVAYLKHAGVKAPLETLQTHPIHIFFEQIRQGLNRRQSQLQQASAVYLQNLEKFAAKAYRRPLSQAELNGLRTFFQEAANQKELGIEQAVRASITRILVSPYFGCRIDPAPEGQTVKPLNDVALASRLSYFLWSSIPDAELMRLAESGVLHDDQALSNQTRRMLLHDRVADFAAEFFGQWLGYRDFEQQESIDRNVFPEFDEPLKQAMSEEPTRLAAYLIKHDLPVTRLLDSNGTFVNQRLANHYGIPFSGPANEWSYVEGLKGHGRAGIMGMGVFLTKNSQPQRTSPVKRGFWVVHKVLGEHIPAPPADVVALPAKETDTNGKTIRQLLALHVESAKCARCHVRFDGLGLALEGFDPIGRSRTKDLAGRAIDNEVKWADGTTVHNVPDFVQKLLKERRNDFLQTFCRKLLGYALGRSLQLSDELLLNEMRAALDKNGDRFGPVIETIVLSPQFRNQRCRDFTTTAFRIQNQGKSP